HHVDRAVCEVAALEDQAAQLVTIDVEGAVAEAGWPAKLDVADGVGRHLQAHRQLPRHSVRPRSRGSSKSRSPSPSWLTPSATMVSARPGRVTSHGCVSR